MASYQLMIIDPDQCRGSEADSLDRRGVLAVGYVNIGEAESYRWFYNDIHRDWLLGTNPNWKDHFFIDVSKPGWHTLLLERVIPSVMAKGFHGVFLDMVDVASPGLYPQLQPNVVALIREIRAKYPDMIIIINNGTYLLPDVADVVDGVAVESTFATYDFAAQSYHRVAPEDARSRCSELAGLMQRCGTKIFAIDYAAPGDTLTRVLAAREARHQGFLSFVSTIELNSLSALKQ